MKIIHTADWHLGKSLKNQPLLDDQNYILQEFLKFIDAENPDAVIIAGDIYDRSIPPVDAVNLFDEIIFKIVERKIPVLCISGNHDSAARLNFGCRLFERSKFFIETLPNEKPKNIILSDNFGEVYFSLIPFFEPAEIENKFGTEEKIDADAANKFYIAEARKNIPAGKRSVAVAHLFVTGGKISESERKFVGAVENVSAENFSAYNYTALGHLHKPQTMKKTGGIVRYSGSLLKYSFDEVNYDKGVTLVEIGGGETSYRHINLIPRRDVRVVEGTVEELLKFSRTEDYIHANLTDKNHVLNAMDKLRNAAFPNILSIKFTNIEREFENANALALREESSVLEQFADFFEYSTGEKLEGDYKSAMEKFLTELKKSGGAQDLQ